MRALPGLAGNFFFDLSDALFRQLLGGHQIIPGRLRYPYQLIQLGLEREAFAVLRILDEEDHQKSHDGRARIDDELPGVRIIEYGATERPNEDDHTANNKSNGLAGKAGNRISHARERGQILASRGCPGGRGFQ